MRPLSARQCELIILSLQLIKRNFESYQNYPSYEFKRQRIEEVESVIEAIREAKKECS